MPPTPQCDDDLPNRPWAMFHAPTAHGSSSMVLQCTPQIQLQHANYLQDLGLIPALFETEIRLPTPEYLLGRNNPRSTDRYGDSFGRRCSPPCSWLLLRGLAYQQYASCSVVYVSRLQDLSVGGCCLPGAGVSNQVPCGFMTVDESSSIRLASSLQPTAVWDHTCVCR